MTWNFTMGHDVGDDLILSDVHIDVIAEKILKLVPAEQRNSVMRAMEHAHLELLKVPNESLHFLKATDEKGKTISCDLSFFSEESEHEGDMSIRGRMTTKEGHTIHANTVFLRDIPETVISAAPGKKIKEIADISVLKDREIISTKEMKPGTANSTVHALYLNIIKDEMWNDAMFGWLTEGNPK